MSVAVVWEIACDIQDCEATTTFGGLESLASARREAKAEGWVSYRNDDFCPEHKTAFVKDDGPGPIVTEGEGGRFSVRFRP